jgi:hypothetical protein
MSRLAPSRRVEGPLGGRALAGPDLGAATGGCDRETGPVVAGNIAPLGVLDGGAATAGRAPRPGGGGGALRWEIGPVVDPGREPFSPPRRLGGGGGGPPLVDRGGADCGARGAAFFPRPSKTSRSDPPLFSTAILHASPESPRHGVDAGWFERPGRAPYFPNGSARLDAWRAPSRVSNPSGLIPELGPRHRDLRATGVRIWFGCGLRVRPPGTASASASRSPNRTSKAEARAEAESEPLGNAAPAANLREIDPDRRRRGPGAGAAGATGPGTKAPSSRTARPTSGTCPRTPGKPSSLDR